MAVVVRAYILQMVVVVVVVERQFRKSASSPDEAMSNYHGKALNYRSLRDFEPEYHPKCQLIVCMTSSMGLSPSQARVFFSGNRCIHARAIRLDVSSIRV